MRKIISVLLILSLLLGIIGIPETERAYAALIDDTGDLNLKLDDPVTIIGKRPVPNPIPQKPNEKHLFGNKWKVYVDGSLAGYDKSIKHIYTKGQAEQYNFIKYSLVDQWTNVFGGNPSFVNSKKSQLLMTISGSQRVYIRYLAELCGAHVTGYKITNPDTREGEIYVKTTPKPSGSISISPQNPEAGKEVTINVSGTAFMSIWNDAVAEKIFNGDKERITVTFEIDGQKVINNKTYSGTNRFNETIKRTFTAGQHTLRLYITDIVGRQTTVEKTISVGAAPPPPPPAGNINADLKMTLNPPVLKTGTTGDINVSLDASGCTSTGSGPFAYRWWVKLNNTYITPSDGVNPGDGSPYFSIVARNAKPGDVIWAKVKVYDYSLNKSSEAETQRTVLEEGVEPPEEPEPQPEPGPTNIPPVAKFKMPSKTGQGTTVNVINQSYDPDGEIVDVEWDVSPSSGISENLSFNGGTITFNRTGIYEVTLTVWDDFGDSDNTTKTIEVTNEPPVAVISAPDEVIQGDDVVIRSNSYDPDGEIAAHRWSVSPSDGVMGTLEGEKSTIWFDKPGEYTISLTVEDEFGLADTAQKTITVKPAIPTAFFDYIGTLKENRKVVLDASNSRTSARYPMVWEATEWQIMPPAGGSASDIKIVSSPDMKTRTVLFKKAGDYKVRVRVKNSAGHYSEWYERTLSIAPDLPPVADFFVMATVLRDPENDNKAKIELIDSSYSPDGDYISQRIWRYKYDSDNDGSFDDESWVTLDSGNNINPVLYTSQVGKYLFELSIKESFGEDTISEFISPSDYRTDDTSDKTINDKICEVINLQPVVDFEVLKNIKADVIFTVGAADKSKTHDLNSKINSIVKTKLAAKNIDANITAIQTEVISSNDINASEIFNKWQKYPLINDPKFDAGWRLDNDRIYTTANVHWTGFWDNTKQYSKDYTIEFDVMTTEHLDPWGFTFRMTSPEHDTYSFYAVEWDPYYDTITLAKVTRWKPNAYDPTHGGPVYHGQISGADGTYESRSYYGGALIDCSGSILVRTSFDVKFNRWDHAKLEVYGNHIVLWINGYKVIDYVDSNNPLLHGSYGPYTASQYNTSFKNVRITSINYKSLDEALKTTTWRDNSTRFLVNISDIELPELNDPVKLGDILSKMLSANIYFIGLGTNTNKSQYETFIARNDGKGVFYYNTNMDTALNQVADYIINLIESMPKLLEQYILLGEEVTYKTYYTDPENDPKYQERWIYNHNPNYFENSLGLASFDGQYLSDPVTIFDKVGKYEVQFQARDNPKDDNRFDNYRLWSYMPLNKLVLYVHRKPIASFTANLTPIGGGSLTVAEDFEDTNYAFSFSGNWSRSTAQRYAGQYSYKSTSIGHISTTSTQFTYTVPSGATNAKISFYYLVRSEANFDFFNFYVNGNRLIHDSGYGSWKYFSYSLTSGTTYTFTFEYTKDGSVSSYDDAAYIDNVTIQYDGVVSSYNVQLTSTSYDLDHQSEPGKGIVAEEWKWKEVAASSWNSGKPTSFGVNKTYLVWLRVQDKEGAWSDPYVSVLSTMQVNLAPVAMFTVDPNTQVINKTISISDLSYDPNGDPIAERAWRVQKPDGTWINYGSTPPTNIPSLGVGTYIIELKVRDNPQYGTTLWSEPYTQQVTVIPENNKPVARFTISPNPIVADEPYTINDTSYDPDGDPIVAREWRVQKPDGAWVTLNQWKPTFEEMGLGDDGTYRIQLRVLDDPSRRHPALTPMWSDPYVVTVQVQGRLIVIGSSNKTTYKAGEAMILYARTEGKAYRVEARMWYPKNEFSSSNVTTLVPDTPLTSPPQDVMTWHTKHTKAEGRDLVVIIPKNMPDGSYQVVFTAYKQLAGGGTKTATDTITVRVKGTIYDHSKSQIIGPRF